MTSAHSGAPPSVGPEGGLIRLALAAVVLLCLIRWWTFQDALPAYLAAVFAMAFGSLLIARPRLFARRALVCAAADALALGVLLAATGGGGSPFFPLYFPAALSVAGIAGRAKGSARIPTAVVGAAAALIGGYLLAALLVGGWQALGSPPFILNAGILCLFCVAALYLGLRVREARERAEEAEGVATLGRERGEKAERMTRVFGPALDALDVGSALGVIAEAARAITGGSYSHVAALRGGLHRTVMDEGSDACPSWWHPSVQRLLLWSCREGKTVRHTETIHGVEGFVAVPFGSPDEEMWGAVIVGGGRVGAEEERALQGLADSVLPALARRPDAAGGLDLPSGLPNAVSLVRVLRAELSEGGVPGVLAVDLGAGGASGSEDLLRRLGRRLEDAGQRAFRYGEKTLVVLVEGVGQSAVDGKVRALSQILKEEANASEGAIAQPAVGFVWDEARAQSPEEIVGAAFRALERARAEKIADPAEPSDSTAPDAEAPCVRALMKAMATRDPYLSVHSAGVSRIAWHIGRALSLSKEQLGVLEIGALLHDIGKIGIPDRILHKPGDLSDEEYAVVKQHPGLGAEILSPFPELAPVVPAVKHHHERFDGLGYPDSLRADKIPILARVVCVADAFDSMTRERPYAPPIPAKAALAEIRRNAGVQFDPRIADALSQASLDADIPPADFFAV